MESLVTHLTEFQKLGKGNTRKGKHRTLLLKNTGQNFKIKYQQIEYKSTLKNTTHGLECRDESTQENVTDIILVC